MTTLATSEEERKADFAEAKEALEHVVDVLNTGTEGAVALWDILTALRGPDSEDSALKRKTTTNIRGKIGLENPSYTIDGAGHAMPLGRNFVSAVVTNDEPAHLDARGGVSAHFHQHYNRALKALENLGYVPPPDSRGNRERRRHKSGA